ncbi:Uma2 family endonuclease [Phormidium sp. FACHB-1136]|uniref:Uma2 family endonuclease n=1 Tax=Phormidium sp. FACHB-1136 TaxID=2692848 RepID=UPI001682CF1E|nr:Uma2 family endonuclease [Phormidium sp. FACHB-1136]MBD2425912.1 Uma2 family endonuclease [Phormidium sp. FACHB-1136]
MHVATQPPTMTVDAYLAWEPSQEVRYEFVNGDVVAMTGGTLPHNDIAINVLTALRPQVRAQGCRINIADAKVNVTPSIYRYPDLVMSCDERDKTAVTAIQYPKLIVEVLPPGTEHLDRGDKFREYRLLPSLQEYVLISSTQINVEIYRRGEGRLWLYTAYQAGDTVTLASVDVTCPIALFYENVLSLE